MRVIHGLGKQDGLAPLFLSPTHGRFEMSEIRLGSRADSYYGELPPRKGPIFLAELSCPEYLLKQYLQTNRTEKQYLAMYEEAMNGIARHLALISNIDKSTYTIELTPGRDPRSREA